MVVTAQTPPTAPRVEHREVRHGDTVIDDYYWLREKSSPQVTQYLEAENAYTAAITKGLEPFSNALYQEMLGRIKQTDLSVPTMLRGYFYYSRTEEGKQYPIQCRRQGTMEAPEEVLLDLNELGKDKKFVGLGAFELSDDQNLLAYTVDYVGFRQFALRVKDLRTGQTLPDTAERVTSLAWAADNKTLFLVTEDAVTNAGTSYGVTSWAARSPKSSMTIRTSFTTSPSGRLAIGSICSSKARPRTPPKCASCAPTGRRISSPSFFRAKRATGITWTIAKGCSISGPIGTAGISP